MQHNHSLTRTSMIISCLVFFFGFLYIYAQTGEPIGSLSMALVTAALIFLASYTIGWVIQAFKK